MLWSYAASSIYKAWFTDVNAFHQPMPRSRSIPPLFVCMCSVVRSIICSPLIQILKYQANWIYWAYRFIVLMSGLCALDRLFWNLNLATVCLLALIAFCVAILTSIGMTRVCRWAALDYLSVSSCLYVINSNYIEHFTTTLDYLYGLSLHYQYKLHWAFVNSYKMKLKTFSIIKDNMQCDG